MENTEVPIKKKRGRKPKNQIVSQEGDAITATIEDVSATPALPKKRGRKPKGGKLYLKEDDAQSSNTAANNVILHLKCCLQDLEEREHELHTVLKDPLLYNPTVPPSIQTYDVNNSQYFELGNEPVQDTTYAYHNENEHGVSMTTNICEKCNQSSYTDKTPTHDTSVDMKDVNSKLKDLKIQLYRGTQSDKHAACFWCTYEFDNHPCYIPKYEIDDMMYGYGSFCQPECAVAYLMKQNLDDSTKFEQYHLLNQLYSKVYDYKKNIKPAPDPYYLLDKFYGNLSIQEYRKLIKSEHMLLVLDKPMTRTLPELHEDSEEIGMNLIQSSTQNSSINTGMYKVKRNSEKQKGPSKNEIIRETFGM